MNGESLLRLARSYGAHHRLALSTVSTYMGGSGDTLVRLERGHDITTQRLARFVQWLSDHWPESAEWPADIPRPTPNAADEAA